MEDGEPIVEMFTDGACSGNPGPGGWGVVLRYGKHEREIYGSEPSTTNNRMELTAAIRGLEALTRPSVVRVSSDSRYVVDVLARGYRTRGGRAYHNDARCTWLLEGQRQSARQGKNTHDIVAVSWHAVDPGELQPCESCCTPQWIARHRR
ncbi:reverse transcriptase-like protein [Nocardia cyriacigeorgica]|uniref:RNase H family protein n=1 Tax=Nocardia cyriacigeorgica TaxID=135487 RepID=UPI001894ED8E|nr:RNase H family protein [Nocardia cyriacigeorgica]MBF6427008.1 reverse transcriptase-like protein [Nocardia cyriacigeorgica]